MRVPCANCRHCVVWVKIFFPDGDKKPGTYRRMTKCRLGLNTPHYYAVMANVRKECDQYDSMGEIRGYMKDIGALRKKDNEEGLEWYYNNQPAVGTKYWNMVRDGVMYQKELKPTMGWGGRFGEKE